MRVEEDENVPSLLPAQKPWERERQRNARSSGGIGSFECIIQNVVERSQFAASHPYRAVGEYINAASTRQTSEGVEPSGGNPQGERQEGVPNAPPNPSARYRSYYYHNIANRIASARGGTNGNT